MPHLFARWMAAELGRTLSVEPLEPPILPELPFAQALGRGGLALSHAGWRCPVHCVEPLLCPATRQHKDWEMARSLGAYARALRASGLPGLVGPLVSRCVPWRQGVGVVVLGDWLAARDRIAATGLPGGAALVATASSCHGVAHLFRLGKARAERAAPAGAL